MLTLYVRKGCPYCLKVEAEVEKMGLNCDKKDISNEEYAKELVDRGGKQQVPYLVDEAGGVEMYESVDIIGYLQTYHKAKEVGLDDN